MKQLWKYILAGAAAALACFSWTCFFADSFNSVVSGKGIEMGIGLFLSFEMVVLAGVIISKINRNKPSDREK